MNPRVRRALRVVAGLGCALLFAVAGARPAAAVGYTTELDVVYNLQAQRLDIYRPVGAYRRPLIIMVHAGGWVEGDKDWMSGFGRYFAEHDVVALSINFRLAPPHTFPASFHDVRDSVAWARANATRLGADPDKIVLMGYSSGANLAMLTGLHDTVDVRAVVGVGGMYDLTNLGNPLLAEGAARYMGPYHWGFGSPVNLVSSDDPAVFLQHARSDHVSEPLQAYRMAGALLAAQVPCLLTMYDGGHDMLSPASPAFLPVVQDMLGYTLAVTA